MTKIEQTRRVVMGLGNTLQGDEGVGVHALERLRATVQVQDGVEILDGGTLGLDLLPIVEECSHLLVLDAVNVGQPAGTVVELRSDEIPLYAGIKMSEHQVTFQEVLGLAMLRDQMPPQLHLVGVQPADISFGVDMTPIATAAIPDMVERARVVLQQWGLLKA